MLFTWARFNVTTLTLLWKELFSFFCILSNTFWIICQIVKTAVLLPIFTLSTLLGPLGYSTSTTSCALTPGSPLWPLSSHLFYTAIPDLHILAMSSMFRAIQHVLIIADIAVTVGMNILLYRIYEQWNINLLWRDFVCLILLVLIGQFIPRLLGLHSHCINKHCHFWHFATNMFSVISLPWFSSLSSKLFSLLSKFPFPSCSVFVWIF